MSYFSTSPACHARQAHDHSHCCDSDTGCCEGESASGDSSPLSDTTTTSTSQLCSHSHNHNHQNHDHHDDGHSHSPSVGPSSSSAKSLKPQRSGLLGRIQSSIPIATTVLSVLCAIECVLLPPLLAIAPLLGVVGEHTNDQIHSAVDVAVFWVLLPIGGLSVLMNYTRHRILRLFALGAFGVALLYFSHIPAHTHDHHHLRQGQGAAASDVTLLTAEGPRTADASATSAPASALAVLWGWMVYLEQLDIIHTVVGLLGSACLLSSNYFSHKAIHAMGLSCGHGHGHGAHGHCHGAHAHGHAHNHEKHKSARGVTVVVTPVEEDDLDSSPRSTSDDEVLPLTAQERL
ncbi:unnamed protein product [Vitrella brassicaformis CCMP3155]|uniref:MerC domain-containing protein n=1 Tax=Vitrella brassicaformis (strain CCMP3155) TaxID=1169540 RepID=A0A0G4FG09_VITBC|nr:unnamed protein product [Vitrella brassicaformis CCMP3155]|mmetsp:Transcript_5745/g.16243  ORF Transcript_5745/g.16243 Transcript_5745/m.16243 type:complete len:346 (+) Transcript_5745:47-1084(+)|eukprot:CEM12007.1 unnamed protein product [Vitrella brassicaformis CCMP3155]